MTLALSYKLFVRVTSWKIAMSGKEEATQVAPIPQKRTAGGVGPPEVQPPPKRKKKPLVKKKARIQELERLLAAEKKKSSDLANQVSQLTAEVGIIRRDCHDEFKKAMKEQQLKHEELFMEKVRVHIFGRYRRLYMRFFPGT
eukprot:SAG11_NODE_210_length_12303_cov_10.235824_12_plen_142_part_00